MFGGDEGGRLERDTVRDTVVTLVVGDVCRAMAALDCFTRPAALPQGREQKRRASWDADSRAHMRGTA